MKNNNLLCCLISRRLSETARVGVETMWSKWGDKNGTVVCPLTLHAGAGLRAGVVAHFGGSEQV